MAHGASARVYVRDAKDTQQAHQTYGIPHADDPEPAYINLKGIYPDPGLWKFLGWRNK